MLPLCVLNMLRDTLSEGFLEKAFSPATPREQRLQHTEAGPHKNVMYVVKYFYSNFEWAKSEDWAAIQSPVLIVQGEDDALTVPEQAKALFDHVYDGKHKQNAYVGVKDAGHQVMMEQPEACVQALRAFFTSLDIELTP